MAKACCSQPRKPPSVAGRCSVRSSKTLFHVDRARTSGLYNGSHAKKGQIIRRRITICPSAGGTGRFVPVEGEQACSHRNDNHAVSNFPKKRLRQCVSSKFFFYKSENFFYFFLSARIFQRKSFLERFREVIWGRRRVRRRFITNHNHTHRTLHRPEVSDLLPNQLRYTSPDEDGTIGGKGKPPYPVFPSPQTPHPFPRPRQFWCTSRGSLHQRIMPNKHTPHGGEMRRVL